MTTVLRNNLRAVENVVKTERAISRGLASAVGREQLNALQTTLNDISRQMNPQGMRFTTELRINPATGKAQIQVPGSVSRGWRSADTALGMLKRGELVRYLNEIGAPPVYYGSSAIKQLDKVARQTPSATLTRNIERAKQQGQTVKAKASNVPDVPTEPQLRSAAAKNADINKRVNALEKDLKDINSSKNGKYIGKSVKVLVTAGVITGGIVGLVKYYQSRVNGCWITKGNNKPQRVDPFSCSGGGCRSGSENSARSFPVPTKCPSGSDPIPTSSVNCYCGNPTQWEVDPASHCQGFDSDGDNKVTKDNSECARFCDCTHPHIKCPSDSDLQCINLNFWDALADITDGTVGLIGTLLDPKFWIKIFVIIIIIMIAIAGVKWGFGKLTESDETPQ